MDEDRIDDAEAGSQEPPPSIPLPGDAQPQSNFADHPMTRLWQDADDRETGAEAIEALRARRQHEAQTKGRRRRNRDGRDLPGSSQQGVQ